MDPVLLSRFQFGFTAFFHFFFPPLTIGLSTIIAVIEFNYWRTGKEIYDRMARFWFKLLVIIFTVGVAGGLSLEFQFGTNWSEYAKFVGDIFGAPLAAEGFMAFFLESSFFGLLLFGRDRISKPMRFISAFFIALGSSISAFWIIMANSWQQTPTAFKIEKGRAVLTDFWGAVFNPSTIPRFLHTLDAAWITGAFFMAGISAYFLLKNRNTEVAKRSMKIALTFAIIASLVQGILGDIHAKQVGKTQPAKMAAFEALWETQSEAPLNIIGFPDPVAEKTHLALELPGFLSWLIHDDSKATVQGLKAFAPSERPPVLATYWSFRIMVFLTGWFVLLSLWGAWLWAKGKLAASKLFLYAIYYSMLLPSLANEFGWFAAEFGRQPWIVYGLLKTQAAVSPVPASQILLTSLLFFFIYSALAGVVVYLIRREVKKALI